MQYQRDPLQLFYIAQKGHFTRNNCLSRNRSRGLKLMENTNSKKSSNKQLSRGLPPTLQSLICWCSVISYNTSRGSAKYPILQREALKQFEVSPRDTKSKWRKADLPVAGNCNNKNERMPTEAKAPLYLNLTARAIHLKRLRPDKTRCGVSKCRYLYSELKMQFCKSLFKLP